MLEEGDLIIPRHHSGEKLEEAGGACMVYLTYDLSGKGEPKSIQTYVETQICEHFERAANKALVRSKFRQGVPETGCEYEFKVALEP